MARRDFGLNSPTPSGVQRSRKPAPCPSPPEPDATSFGAKSEPHYYTFDTDQLTLVTDKKHPLYDTRVELPVDETLVESILMFGVLDPIKITRDASKSTSRVSDERLPPPLRRWCERW
jgi:hypothetical protein